MVKRWWTGLFVLAVLAGCTVAGERSTPSPQGRPTQPAATPSAGRVAYGQPFDLRMGAAATVEATGVMVRFIAVENDSRCPIDVTCVRAGDATVVLLVSSAGSPSSRLSLVIGAEDSPRSTGQVGGAVLTVLVLSPAPVSTQTIAQGDYIVRVVARQA